MVLYFLYLGYLCVRWYVIIEPFWYLVSSHVSYIIIVLLLQAWANWLLPNKTNHLQTNEPQHIPGQHIPGQQQVNMCRVFIVCLSVFPLDIQFLRGRLGLNKPVNPSNVLCLSQIRTWRFISQDCGQFLCQYFDIRVSCLFRWYFREMVDHHLLHNNRVSEKSFLRVKYLRN